MTNNQITIVKFFLVQQTVLDYWIREGLHCVYLASSDVHSCITYMHAIVHVFSVVGNLICTILIKSTIDFLQKQLL